MIFIIDNNLFYLLVIAALLATAISYCECARGCDVSACATGNNRIGSESARRETDQPVTDPGRSCEKSADSDHWPVNWWISIIKVYFFLYKSVKCKIM